MNIDIAALRAIEKEKGISLDTVIETIETALLTAYRHTEGHQPTRAGRDRPQDRRGAGDGARDRRGRQRGRREWDDTPEDFGRIAATTARQVILQRLRDAEHETHASASSPAARG